MTGPAVPEPSDLSRPFWDGTRRGELVLQWCLTCERGIHYPRALCPHCGGVELGHRSSPGTGTVYAQARHTPRDGAPVLVALIDLDEGVRLLSHLLEPAATGARVVLDWQPLDDGRALPVFRPDHPTEPSGEKL